MPPQEKIPPQENGRDAKTASKQPAIKESYPGSTHGHSKEEDATSQVTGELMRYCEMTSLDRIPDITATNATKTETGISSGEDSTWATVKMKMSRQSSHADTDLKETNAKAGEKVSPPAAAPSSSPVQDEKPAMDFDDMLPHVGEFGLYQKILFTALAPFAFFVAFVYFTQIFITVTPEGYWCNIPELKNLTAEQR
jgi:hypothetical protein